MRILRLTNSDDLNPNVPERLRSPAVAERLLVEATGEPSETVVRIIWPDPGLPGLIDDWIRRYEPDLILLVVTSFWFTYESVPLKIERKFGLLGKPLARAGYRAAASPTFSQSRLYHAGRRLAIRTVGGAVHVPPARVVATIEACIRTILAHENVALVVRGPQTAFTSDAGHRARQRAERRWWEVHGAVERFCGQLHVEYISFEKPVSNENGGGRFQGDFVHVTEEGHRERAEAEAAAMLAAWRKLHGET